jgi:hypothetical protein
VIVEPLPPKGGFRNFVYLKNAGKFEIFSGVNKLLKVISPL